MSSPASGSLRGLRVVVVAVAGTLLAAAAHVTAGGELPSTTAVAMASVIPAIGGLWLSRRRRGWFSIAAVLGVVQVLLHAWLMSTTATRICLSGGGGHAAHAAAAMVQCSSPSRMAGMSLTGSGVGAGAPAGVLSGGWLVDGPSAMVLAHLVAVLATAVVLAAGERAVWQLVQWLRPALRVVRAEILVIPGRPRMVPVRVTPAFRRSCVEQGGPGRRGPPAQL